MHTKPSFRTPACLQATWASVMSNLDANNALAPLAGPGHFNDPDLLQVGEGGEGKKERCGPAQRP